MKDERQKMERLWTSADDNSWRSIILNSISRLSSFASILLVTLVLVSCGAKSGHFRIEGRFRNLNQGEFYVYSPDGGIDGFDTIKVADGRFSYEIPLENEATFVLIFPNYSEQAVFGESGATATLTGDVSHLKEMEVEGTDENKLMTEFRQKANRLSPPEALNAAVDFIKENPKSLVSRYLIDKYLIKTEQPNYEQAYELTSQMLKEDPDNGRLAMFNKQLKSLKASTVNNKLPSFSATDINGATVNLGKLNGRVNVINVWSTWSYDSQNIQRQLQMLKKDHGNNIALLSICIDASVKDCRRFNKTDSIQWPNVCDGKMWDTPLLAKFGIATIPGNIIADKSGKIIARNLNASQLRERIESILK